jgi:hypothetical protein
MKQQRTHSTQPRIHSTQLQTHTTRLQTHEAQQISAYVQRTPYIYQSSFARKEFFLMARNGRNENRNYGVDLCSNLCIPTHVLPIMGCVNRIPLDRVVAIVSLVLRMEPCLLSWKTSQGHLGLYLRKSTGDKQFEVLIFLRSVRIPTPTNFLFIISCL